MGFGQGAGEKGEKKDKLEGIHETLGVSEDINHSNGKL